MTAVELEEPDEETSLAIDPDGTPLFLGFYGRKHSGKTHLATTYARSWPYDGVIINNARDIDPDHAWTTPWPMPFELVGNLPNGRKLYRTEWPELPDGLTHVMWEYTPDHSDPHWRYKIDAVIGAFHRAGDPMLFPGALPRFLLVDEIGEIALSYDIGPDLDTVLHYGRHNGDWLACCGPRTKNVATLVITQADRLFLFALPAQQDRKRVADDFGVEEAALTNELRRLPEHGYVVVDVSRPDLIVAYPPLP